MVNKNSFKFKKINKINIEFIDNTIIFFSIESYSMLNFFKNYISLLHINLKHRCDLSKYSKILGGMQILLINFKKTLNRGENSFIINNKMGTQSLPHTSEEKTSWALAP